MSKFTVKTELNNITQLKDGSFDYNQEIVSMHWTALPVTFRQQALEKAKEARKQHDRINEYIRTGNKKKFLDPDIGPDQLKDEEEVFNPDGTSFKWYY